MNSPVFPNSETAKDNFFGWVSMKMIKGLRTKAWDNKFMRGYSNDLRINSLIMKNGDILSGMVFNEVVIINNIKNVSRENTKVLSGGNK